MEENPTMAWLFAQLLINAKIKPNLLHIDGFTYLGNNQTLLTGEGSIDRRGSLAGFYTPVCRRTTLQFKQTAEV
jgi:hypothetical protein